MLNIHSFLQEIRKRIKMTMNRCYKPCLLIVAYTLAAIIILFQYDASEENDKNVIEAYAKADIIGPFVETHEETAKKANIQADQESQDITIQNENISEVNIMDTVHAVVVGAIDEAYQDQQQEQIEKERAKRLAEDKKVRKKAAEIRAKKKAAKEARQKKEEAIRKAKAAKAAKAAKEARAAKEAASKNAISLSSSEREVLERIVEAEATGEDLKGRILVANVILNRVKSSKFPNTVKGVVFQKNGGNVQFSPTKDGRYWSVGITNTTKDAVNQALAGTDYSQGATYFSARSKADPGNMSWFDRNLTWLFRYKGHEFYK